jgi:hypothetical protein
MDCRMAFSAPVSQGERPQTVWVTWVCWASMALISVRGTADRDAARLHGRIHLRVDIVLFLAAQTFIRLVLGPKIHSLVAAGNRVRHSRRFIARLDSGDAA